MNPKIVIYSADWCPYCNRAKSFFKERGLNFEEINVDREPHLREEITKKTGHKTIPQIFIGERFIGGFSDLSELEAKGELDKILHG